ncbi:transcriptional corepressor LEUNIG [Trifolium repens]|nr:transcriptional corepressor LEUNIG [Trifolium repens]
MELPQEYWRHRTLFEIARAIVEDNSKQIVKVKKEAEKVMKYVAKQQHVPVIIPAQSSVVPEVPKADVPEVSKADKLITAVDVSHALVADAGKVVIDDEVTPKQDVETAYKARTAAPQITSFSMPLKDVTDEIVQGELAVSEPVLQQITEPVDSEKMVDASSDDGEEIVIETQLTRMVNDEFDDVVQKELQVANLITPVLRVHALICLYGKFLAVARQNVITIIEWPTLRVFNKLQGHVKDINSICWDVTGKRIASTSEDDVRVCSVFNGKQWTHDYLSKGKRFQSVIFHPRYHNVVVIGGYRVYSSLHIHYDHCVPCISPFKQLLQSFDIFVHDFLVKSGFPNTAESFRNEAQIIRVIPPEFDQRPRGILYDVLSYRASSSQSQAPNVAAIMDTTPQIIRDGYSIQHLSHTPQMRQHPVISEFDHEPYGFLHDFWILFYDKYISRKQMPGPSSQSQVIVQPSHTSLDSQDPNVGVVMNTTPQIIMQEKYSFQHHSSKFLFSTSLASQFCHFIYCIYLSFATWIRVILLLTSESHLSTILEVRFQPGSNIFATCSTDKTVKVWNANTPASALYEFKHNGTVRSLDFEPLGRILCSSDNHGELKVWDLKQKFMISSSKEGGSLVRFQPGYGKFLAVAKQNVITIIEWLGLRVFNNLQGHVKDINSICWDVTGKRIASTSEDDVRVWSVFNGRQWTHEYLSKGKRFQSVIFHPRYHNVVVIGGHQCLELWILENGGQRHSLRASEVSITGLAATTAQSGLIASASNDSVVKIWK